MVSDEAGGRVDGSDEPSPTGRSPETDTHRSPDTDGERNPDTDGAEPSAGPSTDETVLVVAIVSPDRPARPFSLEAEAPSHEQERSRPSQTTGAAGPQPRRSDDIDIDIEEHTGESFAGHVVGHDRLADALTAFGSTLESIRAAQSQRPRHTLPGGSSTGQKRVAQVVQATPVAAAEVVALLRSGRATVAELRLDLDDPAAGRGDVVFPGKLRMPGGTQRRVDLRVYPTASGNLTVLELLPRRDWMPQTRRYLRRGVPAITALTDSIEAPEPPPPR